MNNGNGKTVQLKTFSKWSTGGQIGTVVDNNGNVKSIWCKLCAKHGDKIIKDPKIRGQAKNDIQSYICGTNYVTKHTVLRHLGSAAHKIACDWERLNNDINGLLSETDLQHSSTQINVNKLTQPKINDSIVNTSNEAYKKLFNAAYILAVDGLPFTHFKTLVNLLKLNGIQLISKCDSGKRAQEFVKFIANEVREHISTILNKSGSFSVLTDGSQARKTGSEKELVYVRTVHVGIPVFFCAALENVDDYGDATAYNLKQSIDSVFLSSGPGIQEKIHLSKEDYTKKLISFTSDGASVNTGVNNGLIQRMREDGRDWLVEIHCVLHRVELSAKDSVSTFFKDVFDFMVLIHYQFKNSGKLTRHFKKMGEINNVKTLKFKKVHGTRFVSHQVRGLQALLHNWLILALTIEDLVRTQQNAKSTPKLNGILRKLKDFSFLCTCILYFNILSELSKLSLSLERHNVLITEVMPIINRSISSLETIKCNVEEANQVASLHNFGIVEIESNLGFGTEVQLQKTYSCLKKDPEAQNSILLRINGIKYVSKAQSELDRLKAPAITSLINCLQNRFSSFDNRDFFKQLFWIDPANWTDDLTIENESLEWCYSYFKVPLENQNFEVCKLKSEWKDFKYTVNYFFDGVSARTMWQQIFQHRKDQFPNVCKLAEVIFCIGPSNGVVEAGFSHLNSMLSDRRLCLSHGSMADLLLIKINNLVWSEKEKELIINSAVDRFLSTRRKRQLDHGDSPSTSSSMGEASVFTPSKEVDYAIIESDSENDMDLDPVEDDQLEKMWSSIINI